jgi:hypothetical protein
MVFKCPECGKEFPNKSGLAGHLFGIHGRRIGVRADVAIAKEEAERALVISQMCNEKLTHFLEDFDSRLTKLEHIVASLGTAKHDGKP